MTLQDFVRVLRKRWVSITLITLLAILGATGASLLAPNVYQAQTQTFVAITSQDSGAGQILSGSQFTLQRVKSYTQIVGSPRVLDPVIAELGLTMTSTELAKRVSADSPLDTVLINISVTDASGVIAARICNAVAVQFGKTVELLETPNSGGVSPVKLSVVDPASVPLSPISPRIKLNLALGALLGLFLGIGFALLRESLDTSVRSPDDLRDATEAPLLGLINFDPDAPDAPLAALDSKSRRSEAFRMIRTNLQYVDVDNPPRSVVITSAVPGEGKSTTACNLAITLGQAGVRVCLVEADLRRPRMADYLGIESAVGLTNWLAGQNDLDDLLVSWNRGLIAVLPSGPIPPNPSELLGSHNMLLLLEELHRRFDVVLFDAAPLLPVTDAAVLARATDGAILVARHGRTTRFQAAGAVEALGSVNARLLGTVLNFVPTGSGSSAYGYQYGYQYGYAGPAEPTALGTGRRGARRKRASGAAADAHRNSPPASDTSPGRSAGGPFVRQAQAPVRPAASGGVVRADFADQPTSEQATDHDNTGER